MVVSPERQDAERADALRATQKAAEDTVWRNSRRSQPTVRLFFGNGLGTPCASRGRSPLFTWSGAKLACGTRRLLRPSATAAPAALRVLRPAVPPFRSFDGTRGHGQSPVERPVGRDDGDSSSARWWRAPAACGLRSE